MGKIGSFGGVSFTVSRKKVLTLTDLKRDETVRWQTHDAIMQKPIPEYLGPGQENLQFKILLKRNLGVNAYHTINILRHYQHYGKVGPFMLGKEMISGNYFYIESISEAYEKIDNNGVIHSIGVDITLKEYPIPHNKMKKKAKSKKTKSKKTKSKSKRKVTGTITIKCYMLNCRVKPSLKGKIKKVLRKNQKYKVYGTKKTDITWYDLGGGLYCSANSKYVSFKKA